MTTLLLLFLLLLLSAIFSGSETGTYTVSAIRLDAEARQGRRAARVLRRLLRSEGGVLISLLVGNNLMLEFATHLARSRVEAWSILPLGTRELFVTLLLTPVVFLFGELLPKDLFRRRPHRLLTVCLPVLVLARIVFLPLTLPLQALSALLERLLGVHGKDLARALRRDEVLDMLRQGAREGALAPHAAGIARRVLVLRETPIEGVMIPWAEVETVDFDAPPGEARRRIAFSDHTRLPARGRIAMSAAGDEGEGVRVLGYVHQLEVLAAPADDGPRNWLRPLTHLDPTLPVDQALHHMRVGGRRMALVGSAAAPLGLVCLADLIAALAGVPTDDFGGGEN